MLGINQHKSFPSKICSRGHDCVFAILGSPSACKRRMRFFSIMVKLVIQGGKLNSFVSVSSIMVLLFRRVFLFLIFFFQLSMVMSSGEVAFGNRSSADGAISKSDSSVSANMVGTLQILAMFYIYRDKNVCSLVK